MPGHDGDKEFEDDEFDVDEHCKVSRGLTSRASEDSLNSSNDNGIVVDKIFNWSSSEEHPDPGTNRQDSGYIDSDGLEDAEEVTYQNKDGSLKNSLSATVTSNKLAESALHRKGYTHEEFEKDMKVFRSVFKKEKSHLMGIGVSAEDCCNVTKKSTILTLIDKDFDDLLKLNKEDFLNKFIMSGVPIFSPIRDSSMINPWIYCIHRIVKSPYSIISHVVLENNLVYDKRKGVQLQKKDKETCFNAIIPVFPPCVAPQMRKIMKTHIYTMCCTNAILRNPHIKECNVHMASLGILWIRMLYENPEQPRTEYVDYRIKCIEATAAQYSERHSFANYRDLLINKTNQALMTESTDEIDGKTLNCESLVKPMFILHMAINSKHITDHAEIVKIMNYILIEYIGRCINSIFQGGKNPATKKRKCPDKNERQNANKRSKLSVKNERQDNKLVIQKENCYDFFKIIYPDQDNNKENVNKYFEESKERLLGNDNALAKFYHKDLCRKAAKVAVKEVIGLNYHEIVNNYTIQVDEQKVNKLRNVSSCGDVSWSTLRIFAKEIGLSKSEVEDLFSEQNMFRYVAHGFENRNSRERLETPLSEYNKCVEMTKKKRSKKVLHELFEKLVKKIENSWLCFYYDAHADIVEPMSQSQILIEARAKNIQVSEDNFDHIYKRYRSSEGLLGNACQSRKCPWFLQPKKDYSAHAATEKRSSDFPYGLHIATQRHCKSDVITIKGKIVSWECRKSYKVTTQATTHERLDELDILQLKRSYMKMDEQ